ncbi:unnamed protein product [Brassica rapa]|uniref:Uncharacterized protein n=2 Tax=Brassica TaxID=3705 RepID=A0A3P5YEC1_BRACM|nr:unnamed protein product [Brassica napus]CAG7869312.1 unnamed protein product [Brassica rapa]CDY26737.1 BnaA06g12850D [Brassica napus]VDC66062.1 unnamed protein product [Brassica rapa]
MWYGRGDYDAYGIDESVRIIEELKKQYMMWKIL